MNIHGRNPLSLPQRDWPEVDLRLWEAALSDGGYFDPVGAAAHWAAATKTQVTKGYSRWLGYLAHHGRLDSSVDPATRVTEQDLIAYIKRLEGQGLASTSIASRVTDLKEAIRVMQPDADLALLRNAVSRLRARETPRRDKRFRIKDPGVIRDGVMEYLAAVPMESSRTPILDACRHRDGVLAAFLTYRPIRLANLADLTFGESLIYRDGVWQCHFTADQTKQRRAMDFVLPEELAEILETYLDRYRPRLLGGGDDPAVWISIRGRAMSAQSIYWNICRLTERLFGHRITPHMFRDCAATAVLSKDPEHYMAAARVLGHKNIKTTLRHYDQAEMIISADLYQDAIAEMKDQGPKP